MYAGFLLRLWGTRVALYIVLGSLVTGAAYWSLQAFAWGPLGDDSVSDNEIVIALIAFLWAASQISAGIVAFAAVQPGKPDSPNFAISQDRRIVGSFVGGLALISIAAIVLGETFRPAFSCDSSASKIRIIRGEVVRRSIEDFKKMHGRYPFILSEAGIEDTHTLDPRAVRWEYWTENNNADFVLQFSENRGPGKCRFQSRCDCWRRVDKTAGPGQ